MRVYTPIMKEREYIEGPEGLANFERFATAILQAPKPKIKAKEQNSRRPLLRASPRMPTD